MLKWHGPGGPCERPQSDAAPVPFDFHKSRTSSCGRVSKTQPAGAAPGRLANGVVADKQCTCPASRLMWERYPPTPPIS